MTSWSQNYRINVVTRKICFELLPSIRHSGDTEEARHDWPVAMLFRHGGCEPNISAGHTKIHVTDRLPHHSFAENAKWKHHYYFIGRKIVPIRILTKELRD